MSTLAPPGGKICNALNLPKMYHQACAMVIIIVISMLKQIAIANIKMIKDEMMFTHECHLVRKFKYLEIPKWTIRH